MSVSAEQVEAGQAVYSKGTLKVYDWVVLGISNRFIWKCPTPGLEAHYNKHLSANHLDVGVGTGYFLDRCRFVTATDGGNAGPAIAPCIADISASMAVTKHGAIASPRRSRVLH